MDLDSTSVLITGGASGLGKATAEHLAGLGARVCVLDRNADAASATAAEIGGIGIACDVTDSAAVVTALETAEAKHGLVRVVLNAAGIAAANRVVGRNGALPLEDFSSIINVNLIGTFNVLRLAAERMSHAEPLSTGERGVIVNTASAAAFDGQIGQAAYSASKGGVAAMTLPIAREFSRFGIRVNAIAPGLFETPMMMTLPEEAQQAIAKSIPFPARLGHPNEFAALVGHIVTNTYLNGEVIRLDGSLRLAF